MARTTRRWRPRASTGPKPKAKASRRPICRPTRTAAGPKRPEPQRFLYQREDTARRCARAFDLRQTDDECRATGRYLVEAGDVLDAPAPRWQPQFVRLEILRHPRIQRHRVDP